MTHLAGDVKVGLVLERALEHASVILNEEKVDRSLSPWVLGILDQSLHQQSQ